MMKKDILKWIKSVIAIAMIFSIITFQPHIVHGEGELTETPTEEVTETTPENGETNNETETPESQEEDSSGETTTTEESTDETTEEETDTTSSTTHYYDLISFPELLTNNALKADEDVTFENNEKGNGVVIKGSKTSLETNGIVIEDAFDFNGHEVARVSIDALTKRSTKAKLAVYLDDETEPVATALLYRQAKKDDWTKQKDISIDLSTLHITGTHKVTLKVVDSSEDKVEIMIRSIEFIESTVPTIYFNINEEDGTILEMNMSQDHSVECYGSMKIQVPDGYTNEYTSKGLKTEEYDLEYIRGRGNSTWDADKKPYKVKLDKKADLLGMGKNKHWVLLANYYDNSLLRNRITYWLGEQLGMEFTPKLVPVDVIMNGEYYGSYYLSQQIRIDKTRVNIDDLEDNDETLHSTDPDIISGGYLLALEPYGDESNQTFRTKNGTEFIIERPEYEDYINETQVKYITDYVQSVEDAIYGKEFKNEDGVSYTDLMDVESTVNYFWMQEFSLNGDGYHSPSTYLYKKRNGKLFWGPLWDFDYVAWGSTEYGELYTTGWMHQDSVWNGRLFEDPEFCKAVVEQWPTLKAKLNELIKQGGQLDQYAAEMKRTAQYNFEKWGFTFFDDGFGYYSYYGDNDNAYAHYEEGQPEEAPVADPTYDGEIERLREWIASRIEWVDKNVEKLKPVPCTITFNVDGELFATKEGLVGRTLESLPEAPEKEGYVFVEWTGEINLTFEEFLDHMGLSEQELYDYFDEEEIEDIKENGYHAEVSLDNTTPLMGSMTVEATYMSEDEIIHPTKIYLGEKNISIYADYDDYISLDVQMEPFDAFSRLKWSTSNPDSVGVDEDEGYLMIRNAGDADITVTTDNGLTATCHVHVMSDEEMEEYEWDASANFVEEEVTINVGEMKQLEIEYGSETPYVMTLVEELRSLDESVVSCGGAHTIYGVEEGTTLVYAMVDEDLIAVKVNVVDGQKLHRGETFIIKGLRYEVLGDKSVACVGPVRKSIKSAKIPATVTFKGHKLKVTRIESKAFYKCKKLKKVTIGSEVKYIESYAFASCPKLTKVTIGKSVEIIYKKAFYKDKKLKSITVKAPQMVVKSKAFAKISKKAKFTVPKKSRNYYRLVFGKKKVK